MNPKVRRVAPDYFPSGNYRIVAILGLEPMDLEARTGVQFDESFDDDGLGVLHFIALELPNGEVIWLGKHEDAPYEWINVYADQGTNVRVTIPVLLDAFGLPASTVTWQLVIDLRYIADLMAPHFGGQLLDREQQESTLSTHGPHLILDLQGGTLTLADHDNPAWSVVITDNDGVITARARGELAFLVVKMLAGLDDELGFRLKTVPNSLREVLETEHARARPRQYARRMERANRAAGVNLPTSPKRQSRA